MSGPDRIVFIENGERNQGGHPIPLVSEKVDFWSEYPDVDATEYIRRDPAVLAALPEVQAIVDAAVKAGR